MPTFYLGIDIAKQSFDAALLTEDSVVKHKQFANTDTGFTQLLAWLQVQFVTDLSNLHACLEATAHYGDALARFLVASGAMVSVVNPAAIRAFAKAEMSRTKTDKADAARIARYCQMHQPRAWTPPSESETVLLSLVRRLDALKNMQTMESNRVDGSALAVQGSIIAVLDVLEGQIQAVQKQIKEHIDNHPDLRGKRDLLTSIPGIGEATAAVVLAELGNMARFAGAKQAAAFVGLCPRLFESGSSVRGRSSLCKMGSSHVRKALYFPALTSLRHNPVIAAMRERLLAAGKAKMAIVGAAMRRLVHLCYGVLKSGKPFDPGIAMPDNALAKHCNA